MNYENTLFPEFEEEKQSFPGWFDSYEEFRKFQMTLSTQNLKVYYGFEKTNNVMKKRSIACVFENGSNNKTKNEKRINQMIHVAFVRDQEPLEKEDAAWSNRMYTIYRKFIDEKPYNGNFDWALQDFMKSETNSIPEGLKSKIENALREKFKMMNYLKLY